MVSCEIVDVPVCNVRLVFGIDDLLIDVKIAVFAVCPMQNKLNIATNKIAFFIPSVLS